MFGKDHDEEFNYEVDDLEVREFLISELHATKEQFEEANDDKEIFEEFREEIEDWFLADAIESYRETKEEENDPYGYRGVSPKDFY